MSTQPRPRLALLLALAVLAAAIAPGTVAAQSDDDDTGLMDSLIGKMASLAEDPGGALDAVVGYARGLYANAAYRLPFHDAERTPEEAAADVTEEFNEHNGTYLAYINERITASTDRDVIKLAFSLESEDGDTTETRYRYLVAEVNDTTANYENVSIVGSTDRDVDETVTLSGLATEEMPDDLVEFREEYAEDNETPPGSYKRRLVSKYAGHVHGTFEFLPDSGED